ncbi:MAG: LysR family transcriptional regulator [Saprospiraceae bacterium]
MLKRRSFFYPFFVDLLWFIYLGFPISKIQLSLLIMNIQQLKYISAVADLKHFGLAATQCYVTQSTLSTMIGKFENEIEVKIFDRTTKPVTITKEGEVLLEQIRIILKEVDNLKESVKVLKGEMSGEFKIGIIPTIAPYLLPLFLSEFANKYEQIQFSVTELTTDAIVDKIRNREIDLGIVALPLKKNDLVEHHLYNEEFVLFDCSSDDSKAAAKIEEINKNKLCLLAEGHCLNQQIINICSLQTGKTNPDINFDFKAGSIDSLIRFVRQTEGLTLLPYLAIQDFSKKDKERISSFKETVPVRSVGIITHKHFVKTKLLELLKAEIQSSVSVLLRERDDAFEIASPI